ncbi:Disease resistance protein (TIR-NBS-LRR class) [Raphanus sativus]|nr:Disease resistance protein (TIR-NBS-LRR class) [Raphanus sativus]
MIFFEFNANREELDDSELVDEIVKSVYEKLFPMGKIGINTRLLEFENLVCKQPWGIRRIGIWGMPGIGKTTLAKAVFDHISGSYEASCFIKHFDKDFHEKGLHSLLEEHFGKILKKLPCLPRDKFNKKRTLVVLDDVQSPSVAESFLRGFPWFSPGSLIIITSRDKQVYRHCQINHVYEVRSLNEKESLQLFSQRAFGEDIRDQELLKLSMEVIDYANGNPFALSFYGKELKGKKPSEMKTTFLKLKRPTPDKIHDLFKRSYEELNDSEKDIFLDVACFFNGEDVDYVMQLLEGCGFLPHVGIDVLVEKCLVTISDNRVNMHNLIQDFGREIINERLSRLWEPWSIKSLLEDDEFKEERALETEDIEGISLDISNLLFDVKPTAFNNMLSLRLLKIYCSSYEKDSGLRLPKGLESLPNELRLLHWENYPLQSLPQDFDPCHLVELNLSSSQLQKLWEGTKNLKMLKMVKLCHSQQLTEIDDICKAQNIEKIDLQGCTKLQRFPATGHLQHLRVVNLSDCNEITNLPELSSNIEELHLQGTSIGELPVSILSLFKQAKLNRELSNLITNYSGVSSDLEDSLVRLIVPNPCKLVFLNMKYCSHLKRLPQMVDIESLQVLDLSGCSELEVIGGLPSNLKELYVNGTSIEELPQLPLSIEILNAHGCVSLISIPFDFKRLPRYYTFSNCFDLSPEEVSEFVENALDNVESIARECQQELSKSLAFSFTVPSPTSTYFTCDLQPGSSVMIQLNSSRRSTLGFAIFVQVSFSEDYQEASGFGISCVCRWKDNKCVSHWMEKSFHCWTPEEGLQMDHTFVFCDFNMHPSTCEENDDPSILAGLLVFEFFTLNKQEKILDESCTVKKCGVHVFTAASEDASSNITRPITSSNHQHKLFYQEVEQVLRVIYDDLDEKNINVFHYITSLFNDEDDDLLAALIASIGVRISYVPGVLASKYLLKISPRGISMLHGLLQKISREIAHKQSVDMASSSSSSSSSCIWKYDIFTSFSEEDDCSNKISHLLPKLECKMKRGKSVGPDLVKEIRESKGLIVVLSNNYVSSTRCLDELVEIMKCKEELAQTVVPIFYNVVPSDVREQAGHFGRVFDNTCMGKSEDEKQKWVQALTDVANIARVDAQKRDNEGKMKKNLRHPQTQPSTEAWAWGLGRACQFTGSFFTKESLPALLVSTFYKPWQSSRSILIRVGCAHSFKIIPSATGQILGVEYSNGGGEEIVFGTSPLQGLPGDFIYKIISLTSPRDAWNVASVSNFFASAAKDDKVWEGFLRPDYSSLIPQSISFSSKEQVYSYLCDHFLIEDGKKSFWLEKESGKGCFMLSARELSIIWGDTQERRERASIKGSTSTDTNEYWQWISIPEARFEKVAVLRDVCWFEVRAKTNSRLLSSGTRYSAYIVFKMRDKCHGFQNTPIEVELSLVGIEPAKRFIYFDDGPTDAMKPEWREDGWMEAELGEFFNEESCDEIELSLKEIEILRWKSGLIIQGIEFRPHRWLSQHPSRTFLLVCPPFMTKPRLMKLGGTRSF